MVDYENIGLCDNDFSPRHLPPPGLWGMRCHECEHWTARHAPIAAKKNIHYCAICESECAFQIEHYDSELP